MNNLKSIIKNSFTLGTWIQLDSYASLQIISKKKIDWIVLDLEHGFIEIEKLPIFLDIIKNHKKIALVRVPNHDEYFIKKTLEAGADGILVPNVKNFNEYAKIIDRAYYPNIGNRSFGFSHDNQYGQSFEKRIKNFKPIIIPMIESVEGINNLPKIFNYKIKPDVLFIGPYDLSGSLKKPGDFENYLFKKNLNNFLLYCKKNKIIPGIHQVKLDKKNLTKLKKKGFRFIGYGCDTIFLKSIKL